MTNKNNTNLTFILIFIAATLFGSVITIGDNLIFASKNKINSAEEGIGQQSGTFQDSSCFSDNGTSLASCNNLQTSLNLNFGNNALGQQ